MIVLIPKIFFIFLGNRARYPFNLCGKPLVIILIVVADIKETKPQANSKTAVSCKRPIP